MNRRLTPIERAVKQLTERDFQKGYVAALRSIGFTVGHHYDSRFSDPGTKGQPDLAITGHGHFWWEELKREEGVLSDEQKAWHRELTLAGIHVVTSRPSDWERMMSYAEAAAEQAIDPLLRQLPMPAKKRR